MRVIARGWAGPSLLAMVLFEKFGQHQPLNRQAERYGKEGESIHRRRQMAERAGVLAPIVRRRMKASYMPISVGPTAEGAEPPPCIASSSLPR
ncbi:transposase [Bradyrhizobium sp. USDA 4448]